MKKLLLKVGISLSVLLLCIMWTNDAIAATIKEQGITSLKTYSATGKITATVGSTTKTKTATVYTK